MQVRDDVAEQAEVVCVRPHWRGGERDIHSGMTHARVRSSHCCCSVEEGAREDRLREQRGGWFGLRGRSSDGRKGASRIGCRAGGPTRAVDGLGGEQVARTESGGTFWFRISVRGGWVPLTEIGKHLFLLLLFIPFCLVRMCAALTEGWGPKPSWTGFTELRGTEDEQYTWSCAVKGRREMEQQW